MIGVGTCCKTTSDLFKRKGHEICIILCHLVFQKKQCSTAFGPVGKCKINSRTDSSKALSLVRSNKKTYKAFLKGNVMGVSNLSGTWRQERPMSLQTNLSPISNGCQFLVTTRNRTRDRIASSPTSLQQFLAKFGRAQVRKDSGVGVKLLRATRALRRVKQETFLCNDIMRAAHVHTFTNIECKFALTTHATKMR